MILICPFQLGIFHDSMRWRRIRRTIIVVRNFINNFSSGGRAGCGCGGGGGIFFKPVVPMSWTW